jgi:sucrose phosphorylase
MRNRTFYTVDPDFGNPPCELPEETHMVYNFALPPLVLQTFYGGDATDLSRWAAELETPSPAATFLNVLDTHDGIGLMGVRGILADAEIDCILREAQKRGAYVSCQMRDDRQEEPYEINATWWSAVNGDEEGEDLLLRVRRYIASRSIALALKGVPGLYIHGALGTSNDHAQIRETGAVREVNRGGVDGEKLEREMADPGSKLSLVTRSANRLYAVRTRHRAFHPRGGQRVLDIGPQIFALLRTSPEGNEAVLAVVNVTGRPCAARIRSVPLPFGRRHWIDLLTERRFEARGGVLDVRFAPYEVLWLKPE